ncbi:MAG: hypothetical protein J0M18_13690 [Ignavibacteria bacterium]|nr:hypothetical protein [Ignavibacteria bacterium]
MNEQNKNPVSNQETGREKQEVNVLDKSEKREDRDYEKSDKPFSEDDGKDRQNDHDTKGEPGNARLEKTFDENSLDAGDAEEPDEQYSDENGEKGVAKDTNNRERDGEKNQEIEAERIQKKEDIENKNREIELNRHN